MGPKAQGRRGPDREVYWHGVQRDRVALRERQLRVTKPRLRKKRPRADESGEVEIPAYTALQADQGLADRMLELVMNGVSTRRYATVLPAMADQVGISTSEVSRETIEAGARVLEELAERDLSALDVLVVYVDGIVFGDYHMLAAVGVHATGRKHVLGLREGGSENATVATGLLEELVERGLRADRRYRPEPDDLSHAGIEGYGPDPRLVALALLLLVRDEHVFERVVSDDAPQASVNEKG